MVIRVKVWRNMENSLCGDLQFGKEEDLKWEVTDLSVVAVADVLQLG